MGKPSTRSASWLKQNAPRYQQAAIERELQLKKMARRAERLKADEARQEPRESCGPPGLPGPPGREQRDGQHAAQGGSDAPGAATPHEDAKTRPRGLRAHARDGEPRLDPFRRAKEEAERRRAEAAAARERREQGEAQRQEKLRKRKKDRRARFQFTSRGQPVMRSVLSGVLKRLGGEARP